MPWEGLIRNLAKPNYSPTRGALGKRASALLSQLSNRISLKKSMKLKLHDYLGNHLQVFDDNWFSSILPLRGKIKSPAKTGLFYFHGCLMKCGRECHGRDYSAHPWASPFGLASLVPNRSRRFGRTKGSHQSSRYAGK